MNTSGLGERQDRGKGLVFPQSRRMLTIAHTVAVIENTASIADTNVARCNDCYPSRLALF